MRVFFSIVFVLLFVLGCESKKRYFEPDNLSGSITFDYTLSSDIKNVGIEGITLADGNFVSKGNHKSINPLPKGYVFLGYFEHKIIIADECGSLLILNLTSDKVFEFKNLNKVVAASLSGNNLAFIDSENVIILLDIEKNKVLFQKEMQRSAAVDGRIASPYFLDSLLFYPTLDGKIVVVSLESHELMRDIVISSDPYFNNVIFFRILENNVLLAATKNRLISISPDKFSYFDGDIKDVYVLNTKIYVFEKNGKISLLDENLNVTHEVKYPFANFVGVLGKDMLYVIEREGYIIVLDPSLNESKIYSVKERFDEVVFTTDKIVYYKNRFMVFDFE